MSTNDRSVVHIVVIFIGTLALVLATGLLVLNYQGKQIDALLATLAGGAVGALTALLASTHVASSRDTPTPVTVSNAASDPVPTTSTPVALASAGTNPVVTIHDDAPASSDL